MTSPLRQKVGLGSQACYGKGNPGTSCRSGIDPSLSLCWVSWVPLDMDLGPTPKQKKQAPFGCRAQGHSWECQTHILGSLSFLVYQFKCGATDLLERKWGVILFFFPLFFITERLSLSLFSMGLKPQLPSGKIVILTPWEFISACLVLC